MFKWFWTIFSLGAPENSVTETRFSDINRTYAIEMCLSNRISVELLLPCYVCRLFLWTIAFPNHTHVISLNYYLFLQIPAEQQNCTSSTWDIFKSQLVRVFVSFNFCIFLLLIIKTKTDKTKTLHKHHERIVISWKHMQKIPKLRLGLEQKQMSKFAD